MHLGRNAQARPLLEPWKDGPHPAGPPLFRASGAGRSALSGELYYAQGHHHDARATLREALRLFRELGLPAEETLTLRTLVALGDDGDRTHGDAHCPKAHASGPHRS